MSRRNVTREIVSAITELTTAPTDEEWRGKLIRASMRHDRALVDHAEAAAARELVDGQPVATPNLTVVPSNLETDEANKDGPMRAIDFDAPFPDYDDEAL